MTRKQATNKRVLTRAETASKRSCEHLQKQLDDALAEIEALNKRIDLAEQERELAFGKNRTLQKEVDRVAQVCVKLRYQRDKTAANLSDAIGNTNRLQGFIHGLCALKANPYQASEPLTHVDALKFTEADDEIPF